MPNPPFPEQSPHRRTARDLLADAERYRTEGLQRAIALAPDVALFHANLGEMRRQAGQVKKAVEEGRQAVEIDPAMAVAWSNLGAALFEMKEFEESADADRRAIAANPDFAQAYCNIGNALHSLKRYDASISAYREAVAVADQEEELAKNTVGKIAKREVCGRYVGVASIEDQRIVVSDGFIYKLTALRFHEDGKLAWVAERVFAVAGHPSSWRL